MPAKLDIEVSDRDVRRLMKKFDQLPGSTQRRVMRPAIRSGASIVNKDAKARAPVRTKALKKSLGIKMKTVKKTQIVAIVGPRVGKAITDENGNTVDPVRYAHLVEFGHGGPHPAAPHPFIRPALESNKQKVFSQIKRRAAQGIVREAKRNA